MSEKTYYQRNRDVILNRAKNYYENDKERLREQARCKYRNYSKEKTTWENMSKEKKQKLKEYKKNTLRLKSLNTIINKIVLIVYDVIYAN